MSDENMKHLRRDCPPGVVQGTVSGTHCNSKGAWRRRTDEEDGVELLQPMLQWPTCLHKGENNLERCEGTWGQTTLVTILIDRNVHFVQGRGGVRNVPSDSREGTSSGRPSQVSSLIHLHEIILEHCLYSQGYFIVEMWCTCPMSSAPQLGKKWWEVNVVYRMGHLKNRDRR